MFWRVLSEFRPAQPGPQTGLSGGDAQAPPPPPVPASPSSLQTRAELRVLGGCHGCSGRLIGGYYEPGAPNAREL
jgi:hypothetical protein